MLIKPILKGTAKPGKPRRSTSPIFHGDGFFFTSIMLPEYGQMDIMVTKKEIQFHFVDEAAVFICNVKANCKIGLFKHLKKEKDIDSFILFILAYIEYLEGRKELKSQWFLINDGELVEL